MSKSSKGFHPFIKYTIKGSYCRVEKIHKVLMMMMMMMMMMMTAAKLGVAEQEQVWGTSRAGADAGQSRSRVELGTG